MSAELAAVSLLNERFLLEYPLEAAKALESLPAESAAAVLRSRSPAARLRAWQAMSPDFAAEVLAASPPDIAAQLLSVADAQVGVAALTHLPPARRQALVAALPEAAAADLNTLLQYPPDSAGALMDPRSGAISASLTVAEVVERIRGLRQRGLRELFVVDEQMRLAGQVEWEDLVLTGRERPIREITRAVAVTLRDSDTVERVAGIFQQHRQGTLPVVSSEGRFLGVIRQAQLLPHARRGGFLRRWFR